jgi:hypothetical protein
MDLHTALQENYMRLDTLFDSLLHAIRADAAQEAARLWDAFDRGLRSHLRLEEQYILPAFAKANPHEAETLRQEHKRIRQLWLRLGVGIDLHATSDYDVKKFVLALRQHATREAAMMHLWAERELRCELTRARIYRWLKAALPQLAIE